MRHHGFTLIELLVVIAIIAILAAILFPVFAKAREKARQTACTNNARQISVGLLMFAQDHDETFPDGGWNTQLAAVYGLAGKSWDCPSSSFKGTEAIPEYGFSDDLRALALGELFSPAQTIMLADINGNAPPANYAFLDVDTDVATRHNNGAIYGYTDGHVAFHAKSPSVVYSDTLIFKGEWLTHDQGDYIVSMPDIQSSASRLTATAPYTMPVEAVWSSGSLPSIMRVTFDYRNEDTWNWGWSCVAFWEDGAGMPTNPPTASIHGGIGSHSGPQYYWIRAGGQYKEAIVSPQRSTSMDYMNDIQNNAQQKIALKVIRGREATIAAVSTGKAPGRFKATVDGDFSAILRNNKARAWWVTGNATWPRPPITVSRIRFFRFQ